MEYVSVLVAATLSYAFGALWYGLLAKRWMAASGVTAEQIKSSNNIGPYVISFVGALVVAGTMRHIFAMSGIDTVRLGLMGGFGLGLLIASPWIVTNYAYSMRPRMLTLIDCGYATIGSTIMGVTLTVF